MRIPQCNHWLTDPSHTLKCVNHQGPGRRFTYVLQAPQNILSKCVYCRNHTIHGENFKLKLCTCAESHALGTSTKFQLGILTMNVISGIVYFCEILLESLWNVSETIPRQSRKICLQKLQHHHSDITWMLCCLKALESRLFIIHWTGLLRWQQRVQSSTSLGPFVRGIHWWIVVSPHTGQVKWKTFPCYNIIMETLISS